MDKHITSGRWPISPVAALMRAEVPRCIRTGCSNRVFESLAHLDMCAEHLLEVYSAMSARVKRAVVPGLPLRLEAVTLPDEAPTVDQGVYYVDFGEYLKIGYTTDIEQRMSAFRTAHPSPQLLGMERGGRALELARHREFAEYHIEREMFSHGQRIFDHLRSMGARVA